MEFAALLTRRAITSPRDGPASGTGTANGSKGATLWTENGSDVSNGSKDEDEVNPNPATLNPKP